MGTGPCVSLDRCEDSCGTLAHVPSGCSAACAHFAHTGRSAPKARFLRMLRARRRVAQSPSGRAVAVGPICFPRAICAICALRASRRVTPLPTSAPLIEARTRESLRESLRTPPAGRSAPRALRALHARRREALLPTVGSFFSPRALRALSPRQWVAPLPERAPLPVRAPRAPRVPAGRFAPRACRQIASLLARALLPVRASRAPAGSSAPSARSALTALRKRATLTSSRRATTMACEHIEVARGERCLFSIKT